VRIQATLNTDNAETETTLHTLILFFEISSHQVRADHGATIALTASGVGTDTSSTLVNFDKVVVFKIGVGAAG